MNHEAILKLIAELYDTAEKEKASHEFWYNEYQQAQKRISELEKELENMKF